MKNSSSYPRDVIINNVQLNWARLDTPVSPFDKPIWQLQISTEDADVIQSMDDVGLKSKIDDKGMTIVNLKRNATRPDGNGGTKDNDKVRVVGADRMALDKAIGNGSVGNVIISQFTYTQNGGGVGHSLKAVQVIDLVEYAGASSVDFADASPSGSVGF